MTNYYPGSIFRQQREPITVGKLIHLLSELDENDPVIFETPEFGAFGSLTSYTITTAEIRKISARINQYGIHRKEWKGVVLK